MWIIAKITPAVNWPGLAYSVQQLLKTRGALAPVPPLPPSFPMPMNYMSKEVVWFPAAFCNFSL